EGRAVCLVRADGLAQVAQRRAVAPRLVVDEREEVVRFGAGPRRERALELGERGLPVRLGGGEATERAVGRERVAAAPDRLAEERGEALAHEPREKPTLLALVERDYALADLVAATLGLVEIFAPVARAPGGLDRPAADDAGLVQNVNERVQERVVEVGRARVAQEEVGHLPELVHEAREAVLDDRDALEDVLLQPSRHVPALEARGRRLDDEHQTRAA